MPDERRSRRIHPVVPALVALVVAGVLIAVVAAAGSDEATEAPAPSSTTTASTTSEPGATTTTTTATTATVESLLVEPLAVQEPTSYRITYDVVENGLPRVEEWTVRRPYESLVLSSRDGVVLTGTSTSRAVLQTLLSDDRGWLPVQPELHRAASDQHPAAAVAVMEVLGLAERAGEEAHLGRPCTRWRTGQPLSVDEPTPPSGEESTEVCIDGAGLVLHERWQIGGSVVVERTATALELEPEIDPATFQPGPVAEEADALGGAFTTIAVQADQETLERLRTELPLPPGYVDDGAVFRAASTGSPGGGQPSAVEIVRFRSSGPALLEVAEVFADGEVPISAPAGVPVAVEGWDEVWFEPGFRTSLLRARLDEASYVELRHHDVAFLFEVLGTLTRR
jgi:hypothetical protein